MVINHVMKKENWAECNSAPLVTSAASKTNRAADAKADASIKKKPNLDSDPASRF
jgi:hypothetical protein